MTFAERGERIQEVELRESTIAERELRADNWEKTFGERYEQLSRDRDEVIRIASDLDIVCQSMTSVLERRRTIRNLIIDMLEDEDYAALAKWRYGGIDFDAKFAEIVEDITGINCTANSWQASYNILIKYWIIKQYEENLAYEEKYNEGR